MNKDAWVAEFANVLALELRPDLGPKFARVVGLNEFLRSVESNPRKAAELWAARHRAP